MWPCFFDHGSIMSERQIPMVIFMRRPANGSLLLRQHAGRAASGGRKNFPARLLAEQKGKSMNVIETEHLVKTYKRFKKKEGIRGSIQGLFHREYEEKNAVNSVSLQIGEGEFLGLIGPNGAGKTTLIKMLTGIIAPTSGRIEVLGFYPNDLRNEFKMQYAVVMGQKSQLFFELTANDTLRMFKEIYGIPEEEYQRRKKYFTELFQVEELMNMQVRTLSLGERMKMELIAALLHNPRILFLDEPTIGLDAVAARQIRGFLKEVNQERGTTILLTSHYMEDIKMLCGRSVVISHGNKIYDGNTEELFEKYQRNKVITATFEYDLGHVFEGGPGTALFCRDVTVLENTPYKKVWLVAKENANCVLQEIMGKGPADICVEEEEIGIIVERIYREGEAYA